MPGARLVAEYVSEFPTRVQPVEGAASDHDVPAVDGNVSVTETPVAVPVPAALEFATLTLKPIWDPADTDAASGVLVSERAGHWTTIGVGPAEPVPALPVVNDAELLIVPQLAEDVGDVMCTDRDAPEPASDVLAPPQVRVLVGSEPENAQLHPAELEATVQFNAPPEGSGVSVIVTAVAVPAPLLVTVIT